MLSANKYEVVKKELEDKIMKEYIAVILWRQW